MWTAPNWNCNFVYPRSTWSTQPLEKMVALISVHTWGSGSSPGKTGSKSQKKLLTSVLPRSLRVSEDTLNLILEASRCSHSRKPSKFENENPRGYEVSLTVLVYNVDTLRAISGPRQVPPFDYILKIYFPTSMNYRSYHRPQT